MHEIVRDARADKAFGQRLTGDNDAVAVGNERLISALTRVKSYLDYGAFTPIQVAATTALNGDGADIAEVREIYHKRRDGMVDSFGRAGWDIPPPAASMFAWAPSPEPFKHLGSLEF